ncbi:MAG: hypothetical protein DIU78_014185 [Pseudomonadota bacterium]|nr:MAG: hypothetical protein DIU78_15200 [Pseudomonadota bacterium]
MSWLYDAPIPLVGVLFVLSILAALELGHRLGRIVPVEEHQISSITASILAIVGLLLAFSFSMAGDRLAARRAAVVAETSAISTFWEYTSLLGEPSRSAVRSTLRRYVALHVEHRRVGFDTVETRRIEAEAASLQKELWALLGEEARRNPDDLRLLLLVPAFNEMTDKTAVAIAAYENRVPDAILLYLFLLSVFAGVAVGYRPAGEGRRWIPWTMFTCILSGVLLILLDVDLPRRGLIQADDSLYLRLQESIRNTPR